jgi:hypothetical protein
MVCADARVVASPDAAANHFCDKKKKGNIVIENPFLTPPQVESDKSRSWANGFIFGFQGPALSTLPRDDLDIEDTDAFDMGVLGGQQAAIEGIELHNACIDLNVEPPALLTFRLKSIPEFVDVAIEAGSLSVELAHIGLAALTGSGVLLALALALGLETFSDDPDTAITEGATKLQEQMAALGFTGNLTLFIGAGIDTAKQGCELEMTRIFRNQQDAKTAAMRLDRPHWLVASWRSDQSGGATVVASS